MNYDVNKLLRKLKIAKLRPYVYYNRGGSIYIKFDTYIKGSLRIADHPQRKRYAYRWNLREDIKKIRYTEKNGHMCCYYPLSEADQMIDDMKRTAIKVKEETHMPIENIKIFLKKALNEIRK